MGWCRALFVLSIVCATAHSKALTSNDNVRKSRQVEFAECCPCPKPRGDLSDVPVYSVEPVVDDCPCRNRAADTEGASSMLSPALQALRTFTRSHGPNIEPAPLLKPEVGLASSVLKTLQEVTNEEYEDALVRDATRSAVKALKIDVPSLQSEDMPGSIINIILNPKDVGTDLEVEPEASHLHETRCIHPLGSNHNDFERDNFKSAFYRQPIKNLGSERKSLARNSDYDMDNQASEIRNSLQTPSSGFVVKSLYEPKENTNLKTYKENPTLKNSVHDKLFNEQSASNGYEKIPDLKLSSIVDNIQKSIKSNSILNKLSNKQMSVPMSEDDIINIPTEEQSRNLAGTLKNLQNVFNHVKKPTNLKNLLKLKDVELIPKQKVISDQTITQKRAHNDDTLINASISDDTKIEQQETTQTEILDAVPSSSNKVESERTNTLLLKPPRIEANVCDHVNIMSSQESIKIKPQKHNVNMQSVEGEQREIVKGINDSATDISSFQNESDEQNAVSTKKYPITKHNSEISSEHVRSILQPELETKRTNTVNLSDERQNNKFLPLIRGDNINSYENFKKVNDDMQQKIRQNLQDVLQVVDSNEKKIIEDEYLKPVININNSKSITEDDLQKMSDSILNASNFKNEKNKASLKQDNDVNKIDNCVPIRDDKLNFVEDNSSSNESVTQSSTSKLNERPIGSTDISDFDVTDRPSYNLKNKNNFEVNKIDKTDNILEHNDKESISKVPNGIPDIVVSNEKPLEKNDVTDSSFEVPKSLDDPQSPNDNSGIQEERIDKDLKNEMSQIKEKTSNNLTDSARALLQDNQIECLPSNLNDMNVQASEPIGNLVNFARPDFGAQSSDRPVIPKFSLGSGLKPYSTRIASPHSINRDIIYPDLFKSLHPIQGVHKNDNLGNVFKNLQTEVLPSLGSKRNNILISKPLNEFNTISDNFKSRTDESLKKLNNILGSGTSELKSNHLYKNVLNNANGIKYSLSRAHADLNNKLQQLHNDWTDKIHTISQRADAPVPLNRIANDRKNLLNTDKKIHSISFEKPRTESNIMKAKPPTKTLLNDEKFKLPQLLPQSLYKAPSLGERKATILATTKRPLSMFTTKRPPTKEVSLKSAPKPTIPRTLQEAIESAKSQSDKFNSKMRDMKTLPSNTKPLRVHSQDYSTRKSKPDTRESLENQENVQSDIRTDDSRSGSFRQNTGLPFQLKAEEFSVLKKLIDGIRGNQLQSDVFRNNDNYDYNTNENLQAPSQNIERIKMPENTLKENVSYKCKLLCTRDNK